IRATNILLQGLPKDIYTLINHYTDAKDISDNVKMLLESSELTKDERESQLYDDFEHFHRNKGETIHEYYVRFVTVVKLNRGLKTSNYDQLYAYLKQHEAHTNENKMMLERYNQHAIDPLAFLPYLPNPTKHTFLKPTTNFELHLTQGTKLQFKMARLLFRMFRGDIIEVKGTMQGEQLQLEMGGHIARQCTQLKRPQNLEYSIDKMLLMQAQENRVVLDEDQLLFIGGRQTNTFDDDVDEVPVQDLALNEDNVFQADQCDAFDSDVDEAPMAQTMFMANLSSTDPIYDEAGPSYDSDILSEVQDHDNYIDSVGEYHEVHEMQNDVKLSYVVNSNAEYTSDSNIIAYE
ncbi:hypothetical protein Tco_1064096, partial [Tanacetum coccineum]